MQVYNYWLKVIDPKKKNSFVVHDVHQFHGRFSSVIDLKAKQMEEFQEQVPETVSFNVGYFEGHQSAKKWICSQEDLEAMYNVCASKTDCFGVTVPAPVMKTTVCLQRKNQEQSER